MCILCVIQKWSRRVATMLPWLVIPLIGLWALSQLLPPAFRFEITSPRLACLFVLLVTLFWYEILMPQLSAWRVRRNARLRERKMFEAIELQKLRKTATRRCRNCLSPYRDQNPGGGRFMCSYCGHISKRPVLDLPVPPGLGISNSGIIKDLVGKGGKLLNGKAWSECGWICGPEWLENGNCVSGSTAGKSSHWRKSGSGLFGGDEDCLAEKSYSGVVIFACRLLTSFFLSIRWLWRKIFRVGSPGDESSSGAEQKVSLSKRGENNGHESRGEKARRKAEEKRQARLEKELLEEEERKQREEVARLVEERRRLRDEKMEAKKDHTKSSPTAKEKDGRKEVEKKRQERRKDRDRGSSKSVSDAEDLEKRVGKEAEQKREQQKTPNDDSKDNYMETGLGHGSKNVLVNNVTRASTGNKYLDRMKGTFFSSSNAFTGGSFFGKGANVPVSAAKETRSNSSVDHVQVSVQRKDFYPTEHVPAKSHMNGDDKNVSRPVLSEPQPLTAPKKAWHQLFTRSSSVPASSNASVISRPNPKPQHEVQSQHFSSQSSSVQINPVSIGLPAPFILPTYTNVPTTSSSLGFSPAIEPIFPRIQEGSHDTIPEETELFEDPCYIPDPSSLLGPVSESLENFQKDFGAGFASDTGLEKPYTLHNLSSTFEAIKPSPIESPLSRLWVADEKHNGPSWLPSTPKGSNASHVDDVNANEVGTYQMWNSPPLVQGSLGLLGGLDLLNRSNKQDQATATSLFSSEDPLLPGTLSPRKDFLGNVQNGGMFSPVTGSNNYDPWSQNTLFPPLSGNYTDFSLNPHEKSAHSEMTFGSPNGSSGDHPFELSPENCWLPKKDNNLGEGKGKQTSVARPSSVGGLFPKSEEQSFW